MVIANALCYTYLNLMTHTAKVGGENYDQARLLPESPDPLYVE